LISTSSKQQAQKSRADAPGEAARAVPIRANRIDSSDLFIGTREVTIGHDGQIYRLRLTAQNKLILTK
jgi:hemin uptake protein HemP